MSRWRRCASGLRGGTSGGGRGRGGELVATDYGYALEAHAVRGYDLEAAFRSFQPPPHCRSRNGA
jgi:hypothetical protein